MLARAPPGLPPPAQTRVREGQSTWGQRPSLGRRPCWPPSDVPSTLGTAACPPDVRATRAATSLQRNVLSLSSPAPGRGWPSIHLSSPQQGPGQQGGPPAPLGPEPQTRRARDELADGRAGAATGALSLRPRCPRYLPDGAGPGGPSASKLGWGWQGWVPLSQAATS